MAKQNFERKDDGLGIVGRMGHHGNGQPKLHLTTQDVFNMLMLVQTSTSINEIESIQNSLTTYVDKEKFNDPFAHFALGHGFNLLQKYEGGLIHYEYAIAFGGDDWLLSAGSYQGASNSLFLLEKDFDKALEYSYKVIELDPSMIHPWISQGLYYRDNVGDYSTAITCLEKAVSMDSSSQQIKFDLAKAHLHNQDEEGLKILEELKYDVVDPNLELYINNSIKEYNKPNHGFFGMDLSDKKEKLRGENGKTYRKIQ